MATKAKETKDTGLKIPVIVTAAGYNNEDGKKTVYVVCKPEVDISKQLEECFAGKSAKYIPKWYKEERETVTFKSMFTVPVMDENGEKITFEEWCSRGVKGAECKLRVKIEDGACYVNAVKVYEPGEEYDPFEGM